MNKIRASRSKCRVVVSLTGAEWCTESADGSTTSFQSSNRKFVVTLPVWRRLCWTHSWGLRGFSKESGSGNTAACHTFCSCTEEERVSVGTKAKSYAADFHVNFLLSSCEISRWAAEMWDFSHLLLRKQLWMTLMMKAAASFSLIWGLKRPLK